MDKIKDFFYYVGDFLICLIILSLMYFLITWKLDDTMPINVADLTKVESINKSSENNESKLKSVIPEKNDDKKSQKNSSIIPKPEKKENKNNKPNTNTKDNKNNNSENKDNTEPKSNQSTENNTDNNTNTTNTSNASVDVTIEIKSGMSGVEIAYMLEKEGLIESADLFLKKLESMEVSDKLYAGEFDLNTGMDEDTIIKILTGGN